MMVGPTYGLNGTMGGSVFQFAGLGVYLRLGSRHGHPDDRADGRGRDHADKREAYGVHVTLRKRQRVPQLIDRRSSAMAAASEQLADSSIPVDAEEAGRAETEEGIRLERIARILAQT